MILKLGPINNDITIGLEVHRQLIGPKLFCSCDTGITNLIEGRIERILHPKRSEMGKIDQAVLAQSHRRRKFIYELTPNVCPVDIDEEPPLGPTQYMVDNALRICLLFGCDIVDNVQFMRKMVIDGSNTTGFQRTAMIGHHGMIDIGCKTRILIDSICLEEDSARKITEDDNTVTYRLDRLGTPEIEISTAPFIGSPDDAYEAAKRIGEILRSTQTVKRGIGSIRQDVNISINGGRRVEVKLIQDLSLIPKVIRYESLRQSLSQWAANRLMELKVRESDIRGPHIDITDIFKKTSCRMISSEISKSHNVVGINLKGFKYLLSPIHVENHNSDSTGSAAQNQQTKIPGLGREFAIRVRNETGIRGLIHSDELPGYGISDDEIEQVVDRLDSDPERDAFVMVCANVNDGGKAIRIIIERARMAFRGVVPEVRKVIFDGSTEFMRPLPGSARMYPETDIPPIKIAQTRIARLIEKLPEDPKARISRLTTDSGISRSSIEQMEGLGLIDLFEEQFNNGLEPRFLSMLLINGFGPIIEDGIRLDLIDRIILEPLVKGLDEGLLAREAVGSMIYQIHNMLGKYDNRLIVDMIIEKFSIKDEDINELDRMIDGLISEKNDLILKMGKKSISPIMGIIMKRMRGRISGSLIERRLKERILETLSNEDGK